MPRAKKKVFHQRFNVKALSANKMFYRAKQLTKEYRQFREYMYEEIPNRTKVWPFKEDDQLTFIVHVGLSSKLADVDNCIKPLLDTFQLLFDFNDKYVYRVEIEKEIVKKGKEYIDVEVKEYK